MVLPCPRRVVSLELVIMCWSQSCRSGSYCSFLIVEHTTTLGEMIALCRHVHSGHIRLAASGAGTEESLLGCLYLPVGMLFSSGDFFFYLNCRLLAEENILNGPIPPFIAIRSPRS